MILRCSSHWFHVLCVFFFSQMCCFAFVYCCFLSTTEQRHHVHNETNFPTGTIKFNVLHHQALISTQQLACQRVGKCLV